MIWVNRLAYGCGIGCDITIYMADVKGTLMNPTNPTIDKLDKVNKKILKHLTGIHPDFVTLNHLYELRVYYRAKLTGGTDD